MQNPVCEIRRTPTLVRGLGLLNFFSAALAFVFGALAYVALMCDAALRSWYLIVGGAFYRAFLVAAVFAVV